VLKKAMMQQSFDVLPSLIIREASSALPTILSTRALFSPLSEDYAKKCAIKIVTLISEKRKIFTVDDIVISSGAS
jgi:hypothetical protein